MIYKDRKKMASWRRMGDGLEETWVPFLHLIEKD